MKQCLHFSFHFPPIGTIIITIIIIIIKTITFFIPEKTTTKNGDYEREKEREG